MRRATAVFLATILPLLNLTSNLFAGDVIIESPDRNLAATVSTHPELGLSYTVKAGENIVIAPSPLGIVLNGEMIGQGLRIIGTEASKSDEIWHPVWGERDRVRNQYNQVLIRLEEIATPGRQIEIALRAYNEGIAFQYIIPEQPGLEQAEIQSESSEFRFTGDYTAWATYSGQGTYQAVPISGIKPNCERPLVVQISENLYAAVAEAGLVDYARMRLAPAKNAPHGVVSQLHSAVTLDTPAASPWRVVMVADSPGAMLENNDIIPNLNPPCAIADTSWIKPGKVIREVTLTTKGGIACVDFAVKHGLQYVEFDAGWYGPEGDPASDATTITLDPKRSAGPLDLHAVIEYAAQRDIGILLYVNHLALEQQLDQLLPLYRDWGIKGIKFGFVNVGSQKWTRWLHDAIAKCADHQFMVDVHDEYRPTGFSRTYPNLMTVEGIGGDETRPTNQHSLNYLFTRMLAGPADNTFCWTDQRVTQNSTHAYQMAKTICFFSPWQFLFWYDRPAAIPETPELEFFKHLPTTWDQTEVLAGEIGSHAIIARKSGGEWYIGAMNAERARTITVSLDFLDTGREYMATQYIHNPDAASPTKVSVKIMGVTNSTELPVTMGEKSGTAFRLVPQ
jgi:alpha-glucosidase